MGNLAAAAPFTRFRAAEERVQLTGSSIRNDAPIPFPGLDA